METDCVFRERECARERARVAERERKRNEHTQSFTQKLHNYEKCKCFERCCRRRCFCFCWRYRFVFSLSLEAFKATIGSGFGFFKLSTSNNNNYNSSNSYSYNQSSCVWAKALSLAPWPSLASVSLAQSAFHCCCCCLDHCALYFLDCAALPKRTLTLVCADQFP